LPVGGTRHKSTPRPETPPRTRGRGFLFPSPRLAGARFYNRRHGLAHDSRRGSEAPMAVLGWFCLDGGRALITGGSRGLGRAMAQAFAEAGADLVLVGRQGDSLELACAELGSLGRKVTGIVGDLSSGAEAEQLCSEVLARHAPVDILV